MNSIWIGRDPREESAYLVATRSARRCTGTKTIPTAGIVLDRMRALGLYDRPTERRGAQLWDTISNAPMATEFAITRFLTLTLAGRSGWALFTDCDVMFRRDPNELFALADDRYAVMCVKHTHMPDDPTMVGILDGITPNVTKMDGQVQTFYARKNWSSVMLWNLGHRANRKLTVEMVNTLPGRDLHRFCWLEDSEIGALPREWNHLVGVDPPRPDAAIVHHTLGTPDLPGYETSEYADEWRAFLQDRPPSR